MKIVLKKKFFQPSERLEEFVWKFQDTFDSL